MQNKNTALELVMSKERDLLKKILATGWLNNTISCEVDDLLTEPEPEPVTWISLSDIQWINIVNDPKILELTGGRHSSEDAVSLAIVMTEEKCKVNNSNSPPTREPLSDDEIDLGYQDSPRNYYDLAFRDGVRFAEKYHKIGINNV